MTQHDEHDLAWRSDDESFVVVVDRYLDGSLSEAELTEFEALLRTNATRRHLFRRICLQDQMLLQIKQSDRDEQVIDHVALASSDDDEGCFDGTDSSLVFEALDQDLRARCEHEAAESATRREAELQAEADRAERLKLQRMLAGQSDFDTTPVRRIVIPKALVYGTVAAVIAIAVFLLWPAQPASDPMPDDGQMRFVEVARVIEQTNAVWGEAAHDLALDKPVYNEPIHLVQGLARLRFSNGAEVVLEAPCQIEPVMADELNLNGGRLVVICDTASSKGFVVRAADARIVDRGTEFGVVVTDDERAEAHVIRGEISFALQSGVEVREGLREVTLRRGQAASFDRAGRQVVVKRAAPASFTRTTSIAEQRFAKLTRKVLADRPVIYYRFDGIDDKVVANLAGDRLDASIKGDPKIIEAPFSAWRVNEAVSPSQVPASYLKVSGTLDEMGGDSWAMELWVRVMDEDHSGAMFNLIKQRRARGSYGALWHHKAGRHGRLPRFDEPYLRVANNSTASGLVQFMAPGAMPVGRWHHIVVCSQPERTRVFVDGEVVATHGAAMPIEAVPADLYIGCLRDDQPVGTVSAKFVGDIAAVGVYPRALNDKEIENHWKLTMPIFGQ